jgi:hypothetical protein
MEEIEMNELITKYFFMNNNGRILISLMAGVATGAAVGILLANENVCQSKANADGKKFVRGVLENLWKKSSKPSGLKEDIEEAVREAFAENPEDYA